MSFIDDDNEVTRPPTVAKALALAEAWTERAAILATLAAEVVTLFGSPDEDPLYLIQRITGGATAASPQVVDDLRDELLLAVAHARREARRILGAATEAPVDGHAPCLSGEGDIAPSADGFHMKVPTQGDEIVGNPACLRPHEVLETRRQGLDREQEAQGVLAAVRDRTRPTRRALGFRE
jgi:hypothetical protein